MTERKQRILIPQYMHKFKCIGPTCEDSCCVGWRVDIDHKTYNKYQKTKHELITPLLEQYVARNRAAGHGEGNYAKIRLTNTASCPFLNEKMLCKIQLNLGEAYLSDVCMTYPRVARYVNGFLERSATMSCPEAARLALLNPELMEFDIDEEAWETRNIIKDNINTDDTKYVYKPMKYLWELRSFSINVLQNRSYPLYERLIMLGLFYQKAQQVVEDLKFNEIPNLIQTYSKVLEDGSLKESLAEVPTQVNIQMELLKELADKRYFMGITSQRYLDCFAEFLIGIDYNEQSTVEEIGQRYEAATKNFYEPFMSEREYVLEHYLVNYVFKNKFPFAGEKSLFDDYMMLVLHYALIKMHLIGIAGHHKGLNEGIVIHVIQSFAKTVEHNATYLNGIAEQMRINKFNTMAYMAILIKN